MVFALRVWMTNWKLLEVELPDELQDTPRTVVRSIASDGAPAARQRFVLRLRVIAGSRIVEVYVVEGVSGLGPYFKLRHADNCELLVDVRACFINRFGLRSSTYV